jgi:hypothetical protein
VVDVGDDGDIAETFNGHGERRAGMLLRAGHARAVKEAEYYSGFRPPTPAPRMNPCP